MQLQPYFAYRHLKPTVFCDFVKCSNPKHATLCVNSYHDDVLVPEPPGTVLIGTVFLYDRDTWDKLVYNGKIRKCYQCKCWARWAKHQYDQLFCNACTETT